MPEIGPRPWDPDATVLASPVYLAGPGSSQYVFNILDGASGWTKAVAFNRDTYYISPCHRARVANAVESHYGGWTIAFAEDPLGVPDWITTFDRNTPYEIVAAFAETLVQGLPTYFTNYLSDGALHSGATPATLLASHRWEPVHGSRPYRTVSPDGHAAYRMRVGWLHEYDELLAPEKSTWRMSAGVDPVNTPAWQAYFSRSTPQPLITASAAVLTASEPVHRAAQQIPEQHRSLMDVRPTEPARSLSRSAAALARSAHTKSAPTRSAPTAATSTTSARPTGSRRQR